MHARFRLPVILAVLLGICSAAYASPPGNTRIAVLGGSFMFEGGAISYSARLELGLPDSRDLFPGQYIHLQLQGIYAHEFDTTPTRIYSMYGLLGSMALDIGGAIERGESALMPAVKFGVMNDRRERVAPPEYFEHVSIDRVESQTETVVMVGARVHGPILDQSRFRMDLMVGAVQDPALMLDLGFDIHLYKGLSLTTDGQLCFPLISNQVDYEVVPASALNVGGVSTDSDSGFGWLFAHAGLSWQF